MPLTVLPESGQTTLCLGYSGLITVDDIHQVFGTDFNNWFARNNVDRLYLRFDQDFQGWTEDAAATSIKFIMGSLGYLQRVAHVNAPDSRRLMSSMLSPVSTAEIRHFETGEEEKAMKWLTE